MQRKTGIWRAGPSEMAKGDIQVNILIVDDDAGNTSALYAGLSSHGYRVIVAEDAGHALRIVENPKEPHPVDLVLTDLKMPDMNGLELIRAAKEVRPDLPCILMTAFGNDSVRRETLALGSCGYVEKPFSPDALLQSIEKLAVRNR